MRNTMSDKLFVWDRSRGRLFSIPAGGAEGDGDGDGDGKGGNGDGKGGDGKGDPPKGEGGGSGDGNGDEPKTFTQNQLSSMLAREKSQGREAAMREASEQLGVTIEEAKSIIDAAREAEDAKKSEADRAREKADRERAEAEAEKETTARERYETRVERAAIRAGVDPEDEDRLSAVLRLTDAKTGDDTDTISTAVADVKEKFPEMFSGSGDGEGNGKRRTPSSDPGKQRREKRTADDAMTRGAERAKSFRNKGVRSLGDRAKT